MIRDTPYPMDELFIKFKELPNGVSLPLCEIISGVLYRKKLTTDKIVIHSEILEKDKEDPFIELSRAEFITYLETVMSLGKIEDIALQVEGEMTSSEVFQFIEKYA